MRRILYATQATGNGHLARALEMIPKLSMYGHIDIMVSGTQAQLKLPFEVAFKKRGISLIYHDNGGINLWKTVRKSQLHKYIRDVLSIDLRQYDLIFNDFEPITAWAARHRDIPVIGISHQASFLSASTPRPSKKNRMGEWVLRNFAPCDRAIGFHFEKYDDFIETPIIRQAIRNIIPEAGNHYTVYLPSFEPKRLIKCLSFNKNIEWHIFARNLDTPIQCDNFKIMPIDQERWLESFGTCQGALLGSGFEGPSEALFLGKKLMTIPIQGHYEQQANAAALKKIGVRVVDKITTAFRQEVQDWIAFDQPIKKYYPDNAAEILSRRVFSDMTSYQALRYSFLY